MSIKWGAPLVFNFLAAKEQKIIAKDTPTLRQVKHSPTKPKLTAYETGWGDILSFTGVQSVQFPEGDPAYAAVNRWRQGQ